MEFPNEVVEKPSDHSSLENSQAYTLLELYAIVKKFSELGPEPLELSAYDKVREQWKAREILKHLTLY